MFFLGNSEQISHLQEPPAAERDEEPQCYQRSQQEFGKLKSLFLSV